MGPRRVLMGNHYSSFFCVSLSLAIYMPWILFYPSKIVKGHLSIFVRKMQKLELRNYRTGNTQAQIFTHLGNHQF